jgi:predicted FMN-binding regulatory protein PaiB
MTGAWNTCNTIGGNELATPSDTSRYVPSWNFQERKAEGALEFVAREAIAVD